MVLLRQHWLFELTALCESLVRGKESGQYNDTIQKIYRFNAYKLGSDAD